MKSLKKLLAAAAVCVMALAVFTACGMSKDEHSDALMKVITEAFKANDSTASVTIEHDTSLDAKAQSILDNLKEAKIADDVKAVIVKRETTDEDDTAGLKKEAKAIADAFVAKESSNTSATSAKIGFGYGKIDGTQYIVCAYDLITATKTE